MSQRDKPQPALNNITAGVCEREDANRTRETGHLDEIQGVVANTVNVLRGGAVGLIDWLDAFIPFIDRMNPGRSSSRFYRIRKSRQMSLRVHQ